MKVLLTGAGGFVGHHTLEHILKTTDWDVVVTDSFRHRGFSARLRAVLDGNPNQTHRVKVVTHDLRTPVDRFTALEFGEPDVIINMASESHVDRSIEEPRTFFENNVALALTMLDYARALPNLKLFIQVSTDEVYGAAPDDYAHVEYDSMVPSNPYAASKAAQEAAAISYWRTYNIPVVLSNTMNIIGERQDVEKFIPKAIRSVVTGEKIFIHARKDGDSWTSGSRFYLHARNQSDALVFTINRCMTEPTLFTQGLSKPLRCHVVGEREVRNDEMVDIISKILGKPKNIEYTDFHSSRPGHDMRYALGAGTLQSWGWVPPVPLESSLERTVRWYLKNKEWLEEND